MKNLVFAGLLFAVSPVLGQNAPTFDWKLRYVAGQKWTQTMKTRTNMTLITSQEKIAPQKIELETIQTLRLGNEVLTATPTGFRLKMSYDGLETHSEIRVNGKNQTQATLAETRKATEPIQTALIGLSLIVTQNSEGKILKVEGLEAMSRRLSQALGKMNANSPFAQDILSKQPAALREMMTKSANVALPPGPLAVGRGYSYALALPAIAPIPISVYGARILKKLDAQSATFDETGTFSTDAQTPLSISQKPKVQMRVDMSGQSSGQTLVDVASGRIQSSQILMRLSGNYTITVAGQKPMNSKMWAKSETVLESK